MDRLSALMLRASLLWLATGVVLGGLMLNDHVLPGGWVVAFLPAHTHMLLAGWLLQFAFAVAYWLLPRRRTPSRPLGYDERLATGAVVALNLGLILRVVAEPIQRAGRASAATDAALAASALLQVAAVLVFVVQLWPRAAARKERAAAPSSPTT